MNILETLRKRTFPHHYAAHQPGAPVLEVKDLSVRYDQVDALKNISFRVLPGERVAVIGPNGAGKSTLFKVIAGVLPHAWGEVKIYGQVPGGHICIAYVPQRNQVDWNFPVNVADVVMMGRIGKLGLLRWPSPADWTRVRKALEVVGLEDLAKRQISELSGGQQQRMFIARALAQEAELMLMDEPLTGLDVRSQNDILSILNRLQDRGVTVLASTHDLNLAAENFDRVMLLNKKMIGYGPAEQVFSTERLIEAYGGQLRLLEAPDGELLALGDSCCDEEGAHDHAH